MQEYNILCDNCGCYIKVMANSLKEAEEKASIVNCCGES